MQLTSLTFVMIVLPVLLLIYYLLPAKCRQIYLMLCSFFLYGWGSPGRVLYLAAFLCYDYGAGLLLEKCRSNQIACTGILAVSVLIQVSAMSFIRNTAENNFAFPFGISIYTLQGLSYLIGIYRKQHSATVRFSELALYLSFFPVLFAGALFSFGEFAEQNRNQKLNVVSLSDGMSLFIQGMAEKVMLADTFGYIFRELRQIAPENMSMLTAWLTTIVFSMYLYFELLGYSEMARGLGKCMGYELPRNFSHPFFASSISAFMLNWNITVVLWFETNFKRFLFRHYHQKWIEYGSFLLMWVLIGAWYGMKFQFLLWGLVIGILLMMDKLFLNAVIQKNYILGTIYTGIVPAFLWVLFFSDSLTEAGSYWKAMIGFGNGILDSSGIYFLVSYLALILIGFYVATDLFRNISERPTAQKIGQKFMLFKPVFHGLLFIFSLASMLYGERSETLWLWL